MSSRTSVTTRAKLRRLSVFSNWIVEVGVYFIDKSSDIDLFYSFNKKYCRLNKDKSTFDMCFDGD